MRESSLNFRSQTSINFNANLEIPANYNICLLQSNSISNYNKNHELIKEKKLSKIYDEEKKKNLIKTKSKRFFKQYDFGVPKYYDFSTKNSYINLKKFMNEKIGDLDSNISRLSNGKLIQNNIIHRSNISSNFSSGFYNFKFDNIENNLLKENTSLRNINQDKNKILMNYKRKSNKSLNQSIKSFITENNNENEFDNDETKMNSFRNKIKDFEDKINSLINKNDSKNTILENENKFIRNSFDEKNFDFTDKVNKNNKYFQDTIQENNENTDFINNSLDEYKIYSNENRSKKFTNNQENKNLISLKSPNNLNNIYSKEKNPNKTTLNFKDKIRNKGLSLCTLYTNSNYFDDKFSYKIINTKNSNELCSEFSINRNNNNCLNQNFFNQNNEYENILVDRNNKKSQNTTKENSTQNFSLDRKFKEETTNITFKNLDTSLSKDYNITFLKKQNEREKDIVHKINQMRCGSQIPKENKQFYLLNFNESLEKEKIKKKEKFYENYSEDKINYLISPSTKIYKKENNGDYMKYEREFKKSLLKKKNNGDKLQSKRNFNYNFDSKKYSSALFLNTLIKFPNISNDPKNFEEMLVRNTNNMLERGDKLLKEKNMKINHNFKK